MKLNPNDQTDKRDLPFPDDTSYARYQSGGGKLSLDDWRRENINITIQRIYQGLKKDYPQVKFGISPFGIGHNRPAVVKGFDPYEQIYCDSELWLKNGWCDYLTPQLYWKIEAPQQPFETLLKFWVSENDKHRNIYAGLFTSRASASAGEDEPTTATSQPRRRAANAWPVDEIVRQVEIAHDTPGAGGAVHFSMKALMNDDPSGVAAALKAGPYKEPALPPASPWLNNNHPNKPHVNVHPSGDGRRHHLVRKLGRTPLALGGVGEARRRMEIPRLPGRRPRRMISMTPRPSASPQSIARAMKARAFYFPCIDPLFDK